MAVVSSEFAIARGNSYTLSEYYGENDSLPPAYELDDDGVTPIFTTPSSQRAWLEFLQELSGEEKNAFLKYATGDIEALAQDVQQSARNQQQKSRLVKFTTLMRPIFQTAHRFMPAVAMALQADPYPTSIVAGGLMCVLQVAKGFDEYYDLLVEWLEKLAFKVSILADFEMEFYSKDERVQAVLILLYGDVLKFCQKAFQLVKGRGAGRVFRKSIRERFQDTFEEVLRRFEMHLDQFRDAARLCDSRRQARSYELQIREAQFQEQSRRMQRQILRELSENRTSRHNQQFRRLEDGDDVFSSNLQYEERSLVMINEERLRKERDDKLKKVLRWLPSVEQDDEHARRLRKCEEETCCWIQEHESFKNWIEAPKSSLLFVTGKPGSGKSVLAARTVDYVQSTFDDAATAFYYCTSKERTDSECTVLLSSLLKQLSSENPKLDSKLEKLYDKKSITGSNRLTDIELITTLNSCASSYSQVFIMVDGLDECRDAGAVLKNLQALLKETSCFKILIFSRPDHGAIVRTLNKSTQLRLDQQLNDTDIETFITKQMLTEDFPWSDDQVLRDLVKSSLMQKAQNCFLYVALQLKQLEGPLSASEVRNRLEKSPQGLEELYETSLRSILQMQDKVLRFTAQSILIWTTNVRTPLSQSALAEALSFQAQTETPGRLAQHNSMNFTSICADLVQLDSEGNYQPVHISLRDYLVSLAEDCPGGLEEIREQQKQAESLLGHVCLDYLLQDDLCERVAHTRLELEEILREHPLLYYAAKNWGSHLQNAQIVSAESHRAWQLLQCTSLRELSMQIAFSGKLKLRLFPLSKGLQSLHILSWFGLEQFAQAQPTIREQIGIYDGYGNLPLDYAMCNDHESMAGWILENWPESGLQAEASKSFPLHLAVSNHWNHVLDSLLKPGKVVETIFDDDNRRCALSYAVSNGNMYAVDKLLSHGADPNTQDVYGLTPLMIAIQLQFNDITSRLLKQDNIDVNTQDLDHGFTALYFASYYGSLATVKSLLKKNARILSCFPRSHCDFPIHAAARKNHPSVIRELHRYGCDVNVSNIHGFRPVHSAAIEGSLDAIKALDQLGAHLEHDPMQSSHSVLTLAALSGSSSAFVKFVLQKNGSLINEPATGRGSTPLHFAVDESNNETVSLLIENGANVDAQKYDNDTPLHRALAMKNCTAVRLLLEARASTKLTGLQGLSVLHYAAVNNFVDILQNLVDAEAHLDSVDDFGESILHEAARYNSIDFVERLISIQPKFEVNSVNVQGSTPLHFAAAKGFGSLARKLVSQGAISKANNDMQTPMHVAAIYGRLELLEILLPISDIEAGSEVACTPFCSAVCWGKTEFAKRLLAVGANPTIRTRKYPTLLHRALASKDPELVKVFFEWEGNFFTEYIMDPDIFEQAIRSGDVRIFELLVDERKKRSTDNCIIHNNWIIWAIFSGSEHMVKKILEMGANPNEKSLAGVTPLEAAVIEQSISVVELLLRFGVKRIHSNEWCLVAAASGRVDILELVLDEEADLSELSQVSSASPLNHAVRNGLVETSKILLSKKAGLCCPDKFGLRAAIDIDPFDYRIKRLLGPRDPSHEPLQNRTLLCRVVEECLKTRFDSTTHAIERISLMIWLRFAIIRLNDLEALKVTLFERIPTNLECHWCSRSIEEDQIVFLCTSCEFKARCKDCHNFYEDGHTTADGLLLGFAVMERLECSILDAANVLLPKVKTLGFKTAMSCIWQVSRLWQWLKAQKAAYDAWEAEYGDRYKLRKRPGQEFLKLVLEIGEMMSTHFGDLHCLSTDVSKDLMELEVEIVSHCKQFGYKREVILENCRGHEYMSLERSSEREILRSKSYLDPSGNITRLWFESLLSKYSDDFSPKSSSLQCRDETQDCTRALEYTSAGPQTSPGPSHGQDLPLLATNDHGNSYLIALELLQAVDPDYHSQHVKRLGRYGKLGFYGLRTVED